MSSTRGIKDKQRQGYQSILIGELGEVELQRLFLRWEWLPRKQLLDQGIDLNVEVADGGRGLGLHFHVQSKATKGKARLAADGIGVGLKKANVDYLESQRNVVFLMFIALDKTKAFWVDAHAAIRKADRTKDGSVYVKVPWLNVIDLNAAGAAMIAERQSFILALQAAGMASVARSVGAVEQDLAALDPRCQVTVFAGSDQTRYEIAVQEEIHLDATLTLVKEEAAKLKEALDYGVTRTFTVESFGVSGSPLIEKLMPDSRGQLTIGGHPAESMDVFLGTRPKPGGDSRIRRPLRVRGPIVRGLRGAHVSASAEDHPLTCDVRVTPADGTANFTFGTDIASWAGKRLILLSGLIEAATALDRISEAGAIAIGFRSTRFHPSLSKPLTGDLSECLEVAATVLRQFDDLRELAILYGKDVQIEHPSRYGRGEPIWWHIARTIVEGDIATAWSPRFTVKGEFTADVNRLIANQPKGIFILKNAPLVVTAAGAEICTIPVDVAAEGYEISVRSLSGSFTELALVARENSALALRRSSDQPFSEAELALSRRRHQSGAVSEAS